MSKIRNVIASLALPALFTLFAQNSIANEYEGKVFLENDINYKYEEAKNLFIIGDAAKALFEFLTVKDGPIKCPKYDDGSGKIIHSCNLSVNSLGNLMTGQDILK